MSTGFTEDGTCKLLPPLAKFPEFFVNYVRELSAAPGSHRASNPKYKHQLEVVRLPTRPKIKMSEYYKIEGDSWLTEVLKHQKEVMEDTVWW